MNYDPKKSGLARTNKAQQRTTEGIRFPVRKKQIGTSNTRSTTEEIFPRSIKRSDRNRTIRGVAPVNRTRMMGNRNKVSAQNRNMQAATGIRRVNKNVETYEGSPRRAIKRSNILQRNSPPQSGQKISIPRKSTVHQTSRSLGWGKKPQGKKLLIQTNRETHETSTRSIPRRPIDKSNLSGEVSNLSISGRKKNTMANTMSAFSQSSHAEVQRCRNIARSGRSNEDSDIFNARNPKKTTPVKPVNKKGRANNNFNAHAQSESIFVFDDKRPAAQRKKNIAHNISSFTFG